MSSLVVNKVAVQLRNRISERSDNVLKKIIEQENLQSKGEAIDYLCAEYLTNERIRLSEERIAKRVKKELEKDLNTIRVRTGYMDKEMKIALDILNHISIQGQFDGDLLFDTKNYESRIYRFSRERIQKMIEHFDQRKKDMQSESDET